MDSLKRQSNGPQNINITNYSKILLKFANVFNFLSFSLFNDHYRPTKLFQVLQIADMTELQSQKLVLIIFSRRNLEAYFSNFALSFLYDLNTRLEN